MEGRNDEKGVALKASNYAGTQASRLAKERRRRESQDVSESRPGQPQPPPRVGEWSEESSGDIADGLSENILAGGELDNAAVKKPDAVYPPLAKAAGASGTVKVEIVVDESGNVIRARAASGHPLLQAAAVAAARRAEFAPTPIKVRGFLTYEFRIQ